MGPIADLVNPNHVPTEAMALNTSTTGKSSIAILELMKRLILQMNTEKLTYSAEAVQNRIAAASEKEKNIIIDYFDKMSDEDKRVELLKKRIGIGRWAIGGSKLIWQYDPEQYDKEREARLAE